MSRFEMIEDDSDRIHPLGLETTIDCLITSYLLSQDLEGYR